MSAQEEDRLLSPAEAAAALKVHRNTLARLEGRGDLTALRTLGGHRRYREAEVEALREKRAAGGRR